MDLERLLKKEELCINHIPPSCVAACPIHIDVKGFMKSVQKGDFEKAYDVLEKRMPMANIIGRICDHPCESKCVRVNNGGALSISEIEKAIVEYGYNKKKKTLPIPPNNKKIAVVGGGISGLTCALELKRKGYDVFIYEKRNKIGGRLWNMINENLPEKILEEEIENIKRSGIKIKAGINITKDTLRSLSSEYKAIFLGSGKWEEDLDIEMATYKTKIEGVFAGGRLYTKDSSIILSLSTGKNAAISIDRYVQKTSLTASREKESSYETDLEIDLSEVIPIPRVDISSNIYSKEEAIEESQRCLLCECTECYKACPHLQYEKLMPKEYIRTINHNERVIMGDRYANKTINSCMLCGLCESVCPTGLDMAEIIKDTRKNMVEKEKMPISAHDFALKDMEFNRSEYFTLLRNQPKREKSKFLFFPGCQLSSSYPEYVEKSYEYLMENLDGGVGIYLNCCGAPAEWGGQEKLFQGSIDRIYEDWIGMGQPTMILACSTCYYMFKKYLPKIEIISLWNIFEDKGLPSNAINGNGKSLLVHDSCTARDYSNIYNSVRDIATKLGYNLIEPKYTKATTKCCGYGGLSYFANKDFSSFATDDRISEEEGDYLAYCAMCRDLFVSRGKRTFHILDLIFGEGREDLSIKKGPTLSERRNNRLRFKIHILEKVWGEKLNLKEEYTDIELIISNDIEKIMDDRLILESDIKKVIGRSEETKDMFFNPETEHYLSFRRILNVTYWVEYKKSGNAYELMKIYSHRMDVQGD